MYRVFISYSRQDKELVEQIVRLLKDNELIPMWDQNFAYGQGFHAQIKSYIAHSHVFLPVITEVSDQRKWVHQEIGYAMALNVPVLPVARGMLPGEMLQEIQAVCLDNSLEELRTHLSKEVIGGLVQQYSDTRFALFQCGEFPQDRALMMKQYCDDVWQLGGRAWLRQKGSLSSLHIPDKSIHHPVWDERYGGVRRDVEHFRAKRGERIAFERHVRAAGCKLIINPSLPYTKLKVSARIVRLNCLLEFLRSMPDTTCQVALQPEQATSESVTILGDWFAAESVSNRFGVGYQQTIFTRHAPSMMSRIDAFEQEFAEHLEARGWQAETSRSAAISEIEKIVAELKQDLPEQM